MNFLSISANNVFTNLESQIKQVFDMIFFTIGKVRKKTLFWTNKKFVFFPNCSKWEKILEQIVEKICEKICEDIWWIRYTTLNYEFTFVLKFRYWLVFCLKNAKFREWFPHYVDWVFNSKNTSHFQFFQNPFILDNDICKPLKKNENFLCGTHEIFPFLQFEIT